jgi:hypothetical protein
MTIEQSPVEVIGGQAAGAPDNAPPKKSSSSLHKKIKRTAASLTDVWFEGHTSAVRGETALWVAVITQALMDALNRSRHPEQQHHKQAAIQWLTGNSRDFRHVCELAGLDHNYVRRKAKRAIVSPLAWRAPPGKGKRYLERKAYRQRIKNAGQKPPPEDNGPRASGTVIIGPWPAR